MNAQSIANLSKGFYGGIYFTSFNSNNLDTW